MASSLRHQGAKMLFILSIVATLFSTINTQSITHLVDLPLNIHRGSSMIHATLTSGTDKYFIQEFISASGSSIKGKIEITGEKDDYNIHYNTALFLKNERLVIHGTECLDFSYQNKWEKTLPGITKPVTNLVLLMGPSILYRHSSLVWKEAAGKNIRGAMMKGASAEINKRLKITYYYKTHLSADSGIENPSRIEFSGYDPSTTSYSLRESLILDIYLKEEYYDDRFANEVQPLPGIGCAHYLPETTILFPKLKTSYAHFNMYEYIQGSTTSRTFSEIHASEKNNLLRVKATLLGVTTEAIYDYNLGVSYLFEEGGSCNLLPGDLNSPGASSYGYFTLYNLLAIDEIQSNFQYMGKRNFEHRSGFPVDTWEAVRYNVIINGKKVDKAVITQYYAQSRESKVFYGYTLVSTTIAIYKLDSSNKSYTLTDGITRDYMNFETSGFEDELHDIFSIKNCKYLASDKRSTIAFRIQCQGRDQGNTLSCTKLTQSRIYEVQQIFIDNLVYQKVSPLRIDNIEYHFKDEQIEVEVTFLDTPNFQYIFNSKSLSVSADTFKKMVTVRAQNENECLQKLSTSKATIDVVIFRPSDSLCGYLQNVDDLEEDTKVGQPCSVYHFPLHNLQRINKEIPLDQMHSRLVNVAGQTLTLNDVYPAEHYKIIDVIDKTQSQASFDDDLEYRIRVDSKLNSNNKATVTVPDVKNFADCYRSCHNSEQLTCQTFSFCQNDGTFDCRVSSLLTNDLLDDKHIEQDKKCSIFSLNALADYTEVPNRKFKTHSSIAIKTTYDVCAGKCHASTDCFSFEYCSFSCSFGGLYTDAATEYDEECSIYHPKVSEKYQKTGNKIVSDVVHTEMNLNLDQCAALCHGWSDGDTECKSFNYCPKSRTESSCSISKSSVKSSNAKITEGGDCSNYELKAKSNAKKSKDSSSTKVTKGTSGSGAFGIIMLFLFIGALLGFASPLAYTKAKQMRNATEANGSFSWTKQVDEQPENIN